MPAPRGGIRADSAGVRRPIDGGGLSGLASRSPGPARSTREEAADVHCGSGFWGGQRPSLAHYVTGMGPMDGATAAGGRSCCLSSVPIDRIVSLLEESSFIEIQRLDGVLYQHQPVLVARRGTG